jgi:hypothetical protein
LVGSYDFKVHIFYRALLPFQQLNDVKAQEFALYDAADLARGQGKSSLF